MTTSAPRPFVRSRTHRTRASGAFSRVTSRVSSAPRRRAASKRPEGAPTTRTRSAPASKAKIERVQAHRAAPLHDHGVAQGDPRPLHRVEARGQPAPATHEVVGVDALGQGQDAYARPQLDLLGPAPEDSVRGARRDAVDAPVRTARRRAGHQAMPAGAARPVDVVERDEAAELDRPALHVRQRPVRLHHAPELTWPGMIG